MDDLEQLIRGSESKSPAAQSQREQERLDILNQELRKAQAKASTGDQRAAGDVEALLREIGGKSKVKAAPADDLESLILGTAKVEAAPKPQKEVDANKPFVGYPSAKKPTTVAAPEQGLKELGQGFTSLADVTLGGIIPGIAGPVTYAGARALGQSPEQAAALEQKVVGATEKPFGKAFGVTEAPAYKAEASRQLMDFIGQNVSKGAEWIAAKTGLPVSDIQNMIGTATVAAGPAAVKGAGQVVAAAKPAVAAIQDVRAQLQQQMAQRQPQRQAPQGSLGSAATDNQTFLNQAIAQATPELAAELKTIPADKANIPAITTQLEADQLPIPVRLTKGQATQDPVLISRERNERGFKEQFAQRLNEQNKALQENASLMKERVAPDVFTTDYVADAGGISDAVAQIAKQNADATREAYQALEAAAGGKFPVNGKLFADNAMKVLEAEDRVDYLPSVIQKKLNEYQNGKEMNFNLFNNLRSDLAAEIRKAQRAGDGNTAYVLGQVREQLENLPMTGEMAGLKELADKARATAKADFDLERSNKLYRDVVNQTGAIDSKDLIQNFVIRSKNKDFADSMNLLKNNDQAIQNLRAGTLDYIIRESTDASGNFLTGKFAKSIENLDVNKKLDALFGSEAQTLRNIAKTGRLIEARPKGSFVNESNTATAAAAMAKQYGERLLGRIPVVGAVVEPATELMRQRKAAKETKQSLKVGAGTRLSDIGKEK